ncbi:MAG: copper resistance protein CopC [Actinomycetota bacterium]
MRRALALGGLVAVGLMLGAPDAGAHALLTSSTPGPGALLDSPPSHVVMGFTEPPDLGLSSVEILDSTGQEVDVGPVEGSPGERNSLQVALPELANGVYTVSWRALSKVDGHLTTGAFSFGIGVEHGTTIPAATSGEHGGSGAERPSALSVAGRWGFYWGLAILLGAAVSGPFVFRGRLPGGWPPLVLAWVLAAAGLVGMFVAERSSVGVSASALLGSDRGEILVARGIGLAAAAAAVGAILIRPRTVWFVMLGVITAAAMLIHAIAGHAAAGDSWRWFTVGTQWAHIAAVGIWVGGLAWLLMGTWGAGPGERAGAVRRFSFLAGFALGAVALTGAARAWDEVGSIGRAFETGFGLTAIGKTALFGGMVALGAYNRYRMVPAVSSGAKPVGAMRRSVGGEVLLAAGVFGLTGIMAGLVPPSQEAAAAAHASSQAGPVVVTGSDFATTVRVRLVVDPGAPGPNRFEVHVEDYDTGEPVEALRVTLGFSLPEQPGVGGSALELAQSQAGMWTGEGTNLSVAGRWRVGVLIEQAADSLEIPLEVQTMGAAPMEPGHP